MKNRESRAALLFLSPAIVILSVFFFAPVIAARQKQPISEPELATT